MLQRFLIAAWLLLVAAPAAVACELYQRTVWRLSKD